MVTKGYGFSVEDIDWSCPSDLEPYAKAHELELQEKDTWSHTMGLYNKIAYEVVLSHFGAGLVGKRSHASYPEKPFMSEVNETSNENKESKEEVAVFEMKQRINLLREQGLPESPT